MPLLLMCRLARAEVDTLCPEFCGAPRLRSATEDVRLPGDLEVNESRSHDCGLQFCFQQSTSNSARPQIDLLFRVLWHRLLEAELKATVVAAGFVDFEITWQADVFSGAPQASSAAEFGTQGINFRARKAADEQEWQAALASLACEVHTPL